VETRREAANVRKIEQAKENYKMPTLDLSAKLTEQTVTDISGDRRNKRRYPLDLAVQYKVVKNYLVTATGSGRALNMSSKGIAFKVNETFRPGTYLELSVSWPVLLNGRCPMKLVVEGRVVRSGSEGTVISMDRYEFRTQGRVQAQPCSALPMAADCR
jgi:hypothetical protein